MKKFYFTDSETHIVIGNHYKGNIRNARKYAQTLANKIGHIILINDCITYEIVDFVEPIKLNRKRIK